MDYEGVLHVRKDYTLRAGNHLYWTWFAPSLVEGRAVDAGGCRTVRLLGDAEFNHLFNQLGFDAKVTARTFRELSVQGAASITEVRLSDEAIQRHGLDSTLTLSRRQERVGKV